MQVRKGVRLLIVVGTLSLAALTIASFLPCAFSASNPDNALKIKQQFKNQLEKPQEKFNLGLAYWIELFRDSKSYRCNNKVPFWSGDAIRIHIIPNTDGYAYIVLKSGSRGEKAVLFPQVQSGLNNQVKGGKDFALPTAARLKFDEAPGIERLSLIFSRKPIDIERLAPNQTNDSVYVSSAPNGSKDLVPTRMQLCWDDPSPVILPQEASESPPVAKGSNKGIGQPIEPAKTTLKESNESDNSLVTIVNQNPDGILAVDVALEHL